MSLLMYSQRADPRHEAQVSMNVGGIRPCGWHAEWNGSPSWNGTSVQARLVDPREVLHWLHYHNSLVEMPPTSRNHERV
jgi:hypothetical protein